MVLVMQEIYFTCDRHTGRLVEQSSVGLRKDWISLRGRKFYRIKTEIANDGEEVGGRENFESMGVERSVLCWLMSEGDLSKEAVTIVMILLGLTIGALNFC